jgi:hypothetical protein
MKSMVAELKEWMATETEAAKMRKQPGKKDSE